VSFVNHLRLSVRDVAASRTFYDPWLRRLGFAAVARDDDGAAWGSQEAGWLILTPASRDAAHDAGAPGLHHVAFKAASRELVDRVHELVVAAGAEVLDPPGPYDAEPDHYAVFFRDPNGLKLEVVYGIHRERLAGSGRPSAP